ncbi:hypothetical protein HLH34_01030 [Gluconacetobacter azotocaptans]|uniref:DUF1003 domain-containing protein n=1 Tax=Gluconacetobacter azotocaptans TaxID=142834 RepID=A0A7W4JPH9_9PROT|nr:hypothetical protein [Gluconacetobacter azotocaptans]MBB2188546.1 hypothetical protein [Gluconacetobacter azotocaptans]GBQ28114.1 hypothetical protein AA13594_0865 [Gluconacetobacter azotocaptans DSM 13594]
MTTGRTFINTVNDRVAIRLTVIFGSIWCVYAFLFFSLLPLVAPAWQNTLLYVSNCIQLVALPALMVGSAILSRSSDERAAADHAALVEILDDVRTELADLRQITHGIDTRTADNPMSGNVSISQTVIALDEAPVPSR